MTLSALEKQSWWTTCSQHWVNCSRRRSLEVIGPKPVALLGTRVWRTLTGYREMPKAGHLEELGAEWTADRRRSITSPGVEIKGAHEEDPRAAGTANSVVEWARSSSSFLADQTHSLQPGDARGNWPDPRTQTRRFSRDWSRGSTSRRRGVSSWAG